MKRRMRAILMNVAWFVAALAVGGAFILLIVALIVSLFPPPFDFFVFVNLIVLPGLIAHLRAPA